MADFKPILYFFDDEGYNRAVNDAQKKIDIFNEGVKWCGQYITVDAYESFAFNMVSYFKERYYDENKNKIQLEISVDKLLSLLDIDVNELQKIKDKFIRLNSEILFQKGKPIVKVDKKPYELWTKTPDENKRVKDGQQLIKSLETINSYATVRGLDIQRGLNSFIRFDIRKNKFYPNLSF